MTAASDPLVIVSAARTPLGRFMGERGVVCVGGGEAIAVARIVTSTLSPRRGEGFALRIRTRREFT